MVKTDVNLIPDDIRWGWRARRYKFVLAAAALVYLSVLAFVFINQRSVISHKRASIERLAAERDALVARSMKYAEITRAFSQIRSSEADLKKRIEAASALAGKRISWSLILKRLSHDIPATVWLKSLSTSDTPETGDKKLRFLGSSLSNRGIADFVFTLENSGYFSKVELAYSQRRDFDSRSVFDFEVFADLKETDEIMYE